MFHLRSAIVEECSKKIIDNASLLMFLCGLRNNFKLQEGLSNSIMKQSNYCKACTDVRINKLNRDPATNPFLIISQAAWCFEPPTALDRSIKSDQIDSLSYNASLIFRGVHAAIKTQWLLYM